MRKLLATVVVLAVLVGGAAVADVVIRHTVAHDLATRIEDRYPGSTATVTISSFPFVGHLAASGTVPEMNLTAVGVTAGPVTFSRFDLRVRDLRVDRSRLLRGTVQLVSVASGTATADISQVSLRSLVGVPVTVGLGTLSVAGVALPAQVTVSGDEVQIHVSVLPTITVHIPDLTLLGCLGGARLVTGALEVTCTTTHLPPLLQDYSTSG